MLYTKLYVNNLFDMLIARNMAWLGYLALNHIAMCHKMCNYI